GMAMIASLIVFALTSCGSGPTASSTATVTSAGPSAAPPSDASMAVTTLSDAGPGSLREALATANGRATAATRVITFKVSGTITLASALPPLGVPVKIDGTTAPD